ncbi:MAG: hypothetical protein RL367_970, partial [Pseudomonadota bacterium]
MEKPYSQSRSYLARDPCNGVAETGVTIRIRYAQWLLAAFLTFILVRTAPFSPRGLIETAADDGDAGNLAKQLVTIGFALVIGLIAVRFRGRKAFGFAVPFLVLLGFALASLAWSSTPLIAGRRLGLTVIVSTALLLAAAQMRPGSLIAVLRMVTVGLAFACLLVGLLYPSGAIH